MEIIHTLNESTKKEWRGCLMLSTPSLVSKMIKDWAKDHISNESLAEDGFEEYVHCTILYGFSQSIKTDDVNKILKDDFTFTPDTKIQFELGNVSRFESDTYDVLHIPVLKCPILHTLHYALKNHFRVETSYPTYNPHITLAYVKPGAHSEIDGNSYFSSLNVVCDQMTYSTTKNSERVKDKITYEEFTRKAKRSIFIPL